MTNRRRLIVDTDGGIDDAAALWWCLTHPSLEVVGVTTVWGNVGSRLATDNVLRILEAAGRNDVPVALGEDGPIGAAPALGSAAWIHGDDGLGNTNRAPASLSASPEPAAGLLQRLVDERAGEVSVLTLGPLSNLGRVIGDDPGWASKVDELVVMGGAARTNGNALPWGEANIAHDPLAASLTVSASWQQPPLLVGLDVTHQATLTGYEFALLGERRTAAAAFLDEPLDFYRTGATTFVAEGECPCHDLTAAIALTDPGLFDSPVLPLAVDTGRSAAWGMTVVDLRWLAYAQVGDGHVQDTPAGMHPWRVALAVDVDGCRQRIRRLFGG
jgi:inosine-uridine nucleoside N-ribohydrolase